MMNAFWSDLVFALRCCRSGKAVTIPAVVILTLGVGLSGAMFALAEPFVRRSLPYASGDQLVLLRLDVVDVGLATRSRAPRLSDWQARDDLFVGLAGFVDRQWRIGRAGERTTALRTYAVSPNYFDVLGLRMQGVDDRMALGKRVWLSDSTRATNVEASIGQSLHLEEIGARVLAGTVASVPMPQPQAADEADLLEELDDTTVVLVAADGTVSPSDLNLVARVRDGVPLGQIETALSADLDGFRVAAVPLAQAMTARGYTLALAAAAAGFLVLGVCVANVLSLLLTRGLQRVGTTATLAALGATDGRLARLSVLEGFVLAVSGAPLAAGIAVACLTWIEAVAPPEFMMLGRPGLGGYPGLAMVGGAVLGGFAWTTGGLIAWRTHGRGAVSRTAWRQGLGVRWLRVGLTAGQVALTVSVLIGASLLMRSYLNLVSQDAGFNADVIAVSVMYPGRPAGAQLNELISRDLGSLRAIPGAARVAAGVGRMVDPSNVHVLLLVGGRPRPIELMWVTPGYFDAVGMRYEGHPDADGVVVNRALIDRHFGGSRALGDPVQIGNRTWPLVGIVEDSHRSAWDEAPRPAAFLPIGNSLPGGNVTYVVSASEDLRTIVRDSAIARLSQDAAVLDGNSLADRLARSISDRTLALLAAALFAVATVCVTVVGVASVVAYLVDRRRRESAIRLALGATSASVVLVVVREVVIAVVLGLSVGSALAFWNAGLLRSLLYNVEPIDWPSFAGAALGISCVSILAGLIPALRMRAISPSAVLRCD